jgi:toxin ParE1/3/4
MRLEWSARAVLRLAEIWEYIAKDSPESAAKTVQQIRDCVASLPTFPNLGYSTSLPNVRRLPVPGTRFVVEYQIRSERIVVVTLWHGAQLKTRE